MPEGISNFRDQEDQRFGAVAVRAGYVTHKQVVETLRTQEILRKKGKELRIGQIMLKRGLVTTQEYVHILSIQGGEMPTPTPRISGRLVEKMSNNPKDGQIQEPLTDAELDELFDVPSEVIDKTETSTYIGKYRVIGALGSGGMSTVYKVHDPDLDRVYACKAISMHGLPPGSVERFRQEARILARLNHPNVVRVHYFDSDRKTWYLIMDLVEGPPLELYMEQKKIKPVVGIGILWIVGRALHYCHAHGVIHRDVKPRNIVLVEQVRPVVIDFGLSRITASDIQATVNEPSRGVQIGTPEYMAPEQIGGRLDEVDGRTDVWALGVILYRMLTGKHPFMGETAGEIYKKALTEIPRRPRDVNSNIRLGLEMACLKALSKRRIDRFGSAGEFADALRPFIRHGAMG